MVRITAAGRELVLSERPEWIDATHLRLAYSARHSLAALYINGLRQSPGVDYTVEVNVITLLRPWDASEDLMVVDYWR